MARRILHSFTVHDVRVVDGDTISAWVQVADEVRILWRIRLRGIEGGELPDADGWRAKQVLEGIMSSRADKSPRFVGNEREKDQFGRHIGDVVFCTGEYLTCALLGSGSHWRRERSGKQHPKTSAVQP